MVLAKRERIILIIAIVSVGVMALYMGVSRVLGAMEGANHDKAKAARKLKEANDAIALRDQLIPKWNDWIKNGLKSDPAEAEYQVMGSIREWAEAEGVVLSRLEPKRQASKNRLPEIVLDVTGAGTQKAFAGLLARIDKAKIPIKVIEVQLRARKEMTDDLSITMRLSTVYMAAKSAVPAAASLPSETTGGRR